MNRGLSPYERTIQEYLAGELRVLNAHLPSRPKSLSELLSEEHPHVICHDGSVHLFKKKELDYLAIMTEPCEREKMLLPILIGVETGRGESTVLRGEEVAERIISQIIGMSLTHRQGKTVIYKPQLALLRERLKTTIQYVFSSVLAE
ncbi:MAG: DUF61 family protein [Dehalococcoidia bacterium]|nr:DUF61 family protein [Dehalococcoidia bacterium]